MEGFFATTIYSFSVLFCLCGCDTLPTYKLYNNTGHTIRILGYDKMGSSIRYEAVDKARCQIAIPDKLVI
ncbi:MAG TPA: hypothetical protein VGR14_01650, partial [Verrucomicrobiae bacterium]|nr:hypothetical protein [Verrucomicrobiae bacterium]